MKTTTYSQMIKNGGLDKQLCALYGEKEINNARERYINSISAFESLYGKDREISIFSVPGRTEISGNHTDHNKGKVIAASVNLDIIAIASVTDGNEIKVKSRGFSEDRVLLSNIVDNGPKFRSSALIRGVCSGFIKNGYKIGSFNAYTDSNVLKGSGLSSSAAFEDMLGTILNHFFNDGKVDYLKLSQISKYAENEFFGKPSGLMDQVACAAGGFVGIDFADDDNTLVKRVELDMQKHGYELMIVNTRGNHSDLNDDYASVPAEMKAVAGFFGKNYLREIDKNEFYDKIGEIRDEFSKNGIGDRAILRAYHFIEENERVSRQIEALENDDFDAFLEDVKNSGRSSFCWLQNIYSCKDPRDQGLTLALMMCEKLLGNKKAAWRVHGGGFAGTIQAFVPTDYADEFTEKMDGVFGNGSTVKLFVRSVGAVRL